MSSILKIKTICIIIIFGLIKSCIFTYKNEDSLVGNVYFSENTSSIKGFRIEEIKKDSIYVRYAYDKELFLGIPMLKIDDNKYEASKNITFYSPVKYQSKINLEIIDKELIYLYYKNSVGELEKHSYKLIYRDSIIDKNIRNVYYSEDGFKLPQSIKNK